MKLTALHTNTPLHIHKQAYIYLWRIVENLFIVLPAIIWHFIIIINKKIIFSSSHACECQYENVCMMSSHAIIVNENGTANMWLNWNWNCEWGDKSSALLLLFVSLVRFVFLLYYNIPLILLSSSAYFRLLK